MKEIMAVLPNESFVYYGDTARIPYGTRSGELVTKYSRQCIKFLLSQHVKLIVIACNTASSVAFETVSKEFDLPIIGVVNSGAIMAVEATASKRVGIIGTDGTVKSRAYTKAITSINEDIKVFESACPLFVPLVEQGWFDTKIALLTAKEYLYKLSDEFVDTLVLGCTHYPLLANCISEVMGDGVILVNPALRVALEVKNLLEKNGINNSDESSSYRFFVSDIGQRFSEIGSICLGRDIPDVKLVDIESREIFT